MTPAVHPRRNPARSGAQPRSSRMEPAGCSGRPPILATAPSPLIQGWLCAVRKPVDGRLLVQLAQPGSLQGSPEQLVRWVGDDADPAAIGRAAAQLMEMAASAAELKVCNGP